MRKGGQKLKALVKLPIGIEFFQEIRTEGFYYVEKTGLSAELLNAWNDHHIKIRHCLPQNCLHGQNGGLKKDIIPPASDNHRRDMIFFHTYVSKNLNFH